MAKKINIGKEQKRKTERVRKAEAVKRKDDIRKLLERRRFQHKKSSAKQSDIEKKIEKLKNRKIFRDTASVNTYKEKLENPPTLDNLKSYKNSKRVFVIGGGESVRNMDLSLLEGEDTIVINKTLFSVPNPTFFVSMDDTFYSKIKDSHQKDFLHNGPAQKVFVANFSGGLEEKEEFIYDPKFKVRYTLHFYDHIIKAYGQDRLGETLRSFYTGENSGFCGLQLAYLLGYDEIYLLGLDLDAKAQTHFHGGYGESISKFNTKLKVYQNNFSRALSQYEEKSDPKSKIYNCSTNGKLSEYLPYADFAEVTKDIVIPEVKMGTLEDLIVVSYFTKNTPYEKEAKKTIASCEKLNLNYDIVAIDNLGNWQANTRYKAKFMLEMLEKYPKKRLLWVDCDAIIRKRPVIFEKLSTDVSVRYQDFRWRKNECLSGTIYMENNERTKKLCEMWLNTNIEEGNEVNTFEQWNLDTAIQEMKKEGLRFHNLPPEYTFIFDSMKQMYPGTDPVIEHFQASRKFKKEVGK